MVLGCGRDQSRSVTLCPLLIQELSSHKELNSVLPFTYYPPFFLRPHARGWRAGHPANFLEI